MNFFLTGRRVPRKKRLEHEEYTVSRAEHEDEDCEPRSKTVLATRKAADLLAAELGGTCHVEVHGHEAINAGGDDGFEPASLSVTVSRIHPEVLA